MGCESIHGLEDFQHIAERSCIYVHESIYGLWMCESIHGYSQFINSITNVK